MQNRLPGLLLSGLVLAATLVFDYFLIQCGMVPGRLLFPALILLLLPTAMVWFVALKPAEKLRLAAGVLLAVLFCGALIYGTVALAKVTRTLNSVTTVTTETANVGVYVLAEDDAEAISQLTDDIFGIMAEIDRTSTDGAIAQFSEELDAEIVTVEFDGLTALADALLNGDCRAIVLNSAFLEVLEEIEGYEDIMDRIREISLIEVVEEVVVTVGEQEVQDVQTAADEDAAVSSEDVFVVYISGIDSRSGLKARSRSDVNILAVVNTATHQILLVSTPRDYYVPLSISGGARDKLTHAGIYGITVSMETMELLYDIDIDYYVKICFEGVEDVVDALGGVSVYSEYSFQSSFDSSLYFTAGYNEMDGREALLFVRERYAFASGDRQRGKNQMQLIKAVIDKAMSPDILMKYSSLLAAAEDNFETSVPYDLIASLVSDQLSSGADWEIITYSVDGTGSSQIPWSMSVSAYVMIPDESTVNTAKALMQAMLSGEVIEQP
ncbi:MAG: LCP family protein [Lachnospiraceae bacterium]|nr:LCP family protein [Lachnospiraceae bacterium]